LGRKVGVPKRKVFCIGFQKTGTTSLDKALKTLGYKVAGVFGREQSLEEFRRTFVQRGLEIAAKHDAVQDMPWPLMFRELDSAFPGSKFILTVRETDKWYRSIADHFGERPYHISQNTYGEDAGAPVGHEERYKAVYEAHNAAVLDYFRDRPGDFLVMDLARGDGWEVLCPFIGEQAPATPFMKANTAGNRRSLVYRLRKRLHLLGIPVGDVGL
jgi:hypothetical protein